MPFSTAYSNDDKLNRTSVISALVRLFAFWLGLNSLALASPTATITGRVTDSLGGALADAQVEVTNIETNTSFRTKTSNLGLYRVPNLPPGYYRVIVRTFGFRTMVKPGLKRSPRTA